MYNHKYKLQICKIRIMIVIVSQKMITLYLLIALGRGKNHLSYKTLESPDLFFWPVPSLISTAEKLQCPSLDVSLSIQSKYMREVKSWFIMQKKLDCKQCLKRCWSNHEFWIIEVSSKKQNHLFSSVEYYGLQSTGFENNSEFWKI